jgi:hypothetical protein
MTNMLIVFAILALLGLAGFAALITIEIKRKNMGVWLPAYFARKPPKPVPGELTHVMFCFVDHYEPYWLKPTQEKAHSRVEYWAKNYPKMAKQFKDADGQHPKHSFFYPEEEYDKYCLDLLSDICHQGLGEIEIHLHHHDDTEAGLTEKINRFVKQLSEDHNSLPIDPKTGKPVFAFIHGNWTLDNAAHDGSHCGINNEIQLLAKLGCYCDFTLPSAPSETQTSKINSIYYAKDDPLKPKSHNDGIDLQVGGKPTGELMLIQGPLGLNWLWRKWGLIPRLENGDIRNSSPPLPSRVDTWIKQAIHVKGRENWLFVKIHTHGAQEPSFDAVLGQRVHDMHRHLTSKYNDGKNFALHYVSAREMYNIAKAAEAGLTGSPNEHRDYLLKRPAFMPIKAMQTAQ